MPRLEYIAQRHPLLARGGGDHFHQPVPALPLDPAPPRARARPGDCRPCDRSGRPPLDPQPARFRRHPGPRTAGL